MTPWIAAAGAFVVSLDSMVNVAFPAMARAFAVEPERIRWVIVCYVFTYAVTSFVGGAVGDRIGHAAVFRAGVGLSALAFVVAGTAGTFDRFLVARVLQGLAAGLVYGTAPGLVTLAASASARGRAIGFFTAAMGLALTLGPLVASLLVGALGWRAVFYARAPLALLVLGWALAVTPARRAATAPRVPALGALARPPVVVASVLSFVANGGIFAIWLLAPFYLEGVRNLETRVAGVLFTLTPLGTALAAPLAGRAVDRAGPAAPALMGLALEAAGLFALSGADAATPAPVLALALFAAGLGLGAFQVPNMAALMAAFPAGQQGTAGGLTFLARTLGVVAGVLALGEVFARRRAAVGGPAAFAESFVVAGIAVTGALALAALGARAPANRRRP